MVIKLGRKLYIAGSVIILLILFSAFMFPYKQEVQLPPPIKSESRLIGEWLAWDEVKICFPKYSSASVIDIDTGLKYHIQRRGGTYHADVQPLTAEDTEIMKRIYNGKWGWKRRAVIVQLPNGKLIAGSMNGMPHGGGSIKDNNFNGHSCIHFKDSITHGSRNRDVAHQMMVWKAAGIIDEQLKLLNAKQAVLVFFAAIDQGEKSVLKKIIGAGEHQEELLSDLDTLDSAKVDSIKETDTSSFFVNLRLQFKDTDKQISRNLVVKTIQENGQYKIAEESVELLLCYEDDH